MQFVRLNYAAHIRARLIAAASVLGLCGSAVAGTLRVVDWNIEADIGGYTSPRPGFNTVLQGMGNEIIAGDTQPIDIMTLEETTSNATTVQPILNMLNGDYAGANYQMSSYQGTQYGSNSSGNGPSALVYNARTVNLLNSVGVGTPQGSGNGEYRQVIRYEFQPVAGIVPFYVYVTHMKSGTTSSDLTARAEEATIIRNDEATLPASATVLYTGDFNYSPPATEFNNLAAAGQGQAYDPLTSQPINSSASVTASALLKNFTESGTSLRYRDDYQLVTSNVLDGTGAISYVSGSNEGFGNNGTSGTTVNSPSTTGGSNTDLAYMTTANGYNPTQAQILSALSTASDHLPNVADYTFTVPEPTGGSICLIVSVYVTARRRRRSI